MSEDPGEVLNQAREAFSIKEYEVSLEKYKWFYDNSLDIDQSYYGVRLSYCLGEWAELAKYFPTAKEELVILKDKSLSGFKSNPTHQAFHEYSSISEYLDCSSEVFDTFVSIEEQDEKLASKIFSLVFRYCATNKKWDVCRRYLGNGYKQYLRTIETFDHMTEFSNESSGEERESIMRDAEQTFKKEVIWLLEMLNYINAPKEFDSAMNKIESDLTERGSQKLFGEIAKKAPNKKRNEMDVSNEPPIR